MARGPMFGRSRLLPCPCGTLTARADGYCSDACAATGARDICLPCGFDGRHDQCEGCRCDHPDHADRDAALDAEEGGVSAMLDERRGIKD